MKKISLSDRVAPIKAKDALVTPRSVVIQKTSP